MIPVLKEFSENKTLDFLNRYSHISKKIIKGGICLYSNLCRNTYWRPALIKLVGLGAVHIRGAALIRGFTIYHQIETITRSALLLLRDPAVDWHWAQKYKLPCRGSNGIIKSLASRFVEMHLNFVNVSFFGKWFRHILKFFRG